MTEPYHQLLTTIKTTIREERTKAIRQLNRSLIGVYWKIGRHIVERQAQHGWGKGIVEQLSKDLRQEFPGEGGYSARNLWDMRRLYETYKDFPNLQQVVAEIPWGQHRLIKHKAESHEERVYYLNATAERFNHRDKA